MKKRGLIGTVLSHKMQKTVVVRVQRRTLNLQFRKTVNQEKRYKAHDEKDECQVGDQVLIVETRPLSREKRWRVEKVLRKGFEDEAGVGQTL